MILYHYKIITDCKKFNDGESRMMTYQKMHDNRTKDKVSKNMSCGCCDPPKPITLKLIHESQQKNKGWDKMSMMEDYHNEEDLAKGRIEKRSPNNPILKKCFGSTYKAVEAYWEVERKLDAQIKSKEVKE